MVCIISDHKNPTNHPIYAEEKELGSAILHFSVENYEFQLEIKKNQNYQEIKEQSLDENQI